MSRVAKITLLLAAASPREILAALQKHAPARYARQAALLSVPEATDNPYRGLAAFQISDAHLFFGRETLTEKLLQRFRSLYDSKDAARLLAILGPSGSGKSSVARAGLLAALQGRPVPGPQPMRMAVLKPGEHPLRALALALCPPQPGQAPDLAVQGKLIDDLGQQSKRGEFDRLSLWAANLPDVAASPLVLLVDQFEEIYTLCMPPRTVPGTLG